MTGIIVGVDGSDASRIALGWAMREAALRHLPLTVLTVRQVPVRPATEIYWAVPDLSTERAGEEAERKAAWEFVDKAASETGESGLDITVTVAAGDAAEELLRAARDADMVVVGSRGSGGFARLLLGSVSSKLAHHAACPLVIVPADRQAVLAPGGRPPGDPPHGGLLAPHTP